MRALKILTLLLAAMLLLTLLLVGYFFLTAKVTVASIQAQGTLASQQADLFAQLQTQVSEETFQGTRFSTAPLGAADDYAFITYTVRVSNQCLVPADMIEVQIVPEENDVLQLGDPAVHALNPKSQGDVTATLLTRRDSHALRDVIVTYYVWGVSFSIQERYGG